MVCERGKREDMNALSDITRSSPQVDDACCGRGNLSKGVDMSHNIMTPFFLLCSCDFKLFRSEVLWGKKKVSI